MSKGKKRDNKENDSDKENDSGNKENDQISLQKVDLTLKTCLQCRSKLGRKIWT